VNPEVRDMMLLSTRLRVWNPDVVVPPSELRCHGRRLMVQSLFAGHVSLHRSHSPISIIRSVESVEPELDCNLQSISASIEAICRKTLQDVNRDSGQNPCSNNFRKKLYVRQNRQRFGCIDCIA
jgi:hypothetical protein